MQAPDRLTRAHFVALYAFATLAAWALGPDVSLYWDAHGYVIQAIRGRAGGLMLGRPTFVLVSHAFARLWISLGGALPDVASLLRAVWTLVAALGAPALAWLALGVGAPARVAWTAGLLLALSPVVAHSSRAVLTDGPSMAVVLASLALGVRASARAKLLPMALAGAALGVAGGLREPSLAHGLTLVGLAAVAPRRRLALAGVAVVACGVAFAAPVGWFVATQADYVRVVRGWSQEMARERAGHPYGWRDLGMFVVWSLAAGPALWFGLATRGRAAWASVRSSSTARVVVGVSALQYLALAFYQDIAFSPRYLLGALPCAVVLPAAWALDDSRARRTAVTAAVAFAVLAAPVLRWRERPLRDALRALPGQLDALPPRAVIVSGQVCPAVVYERELRRLAGGTSDLVQVCPGWRWPAPLAARLDALRAEGRPVVIDLRAAVWVGARQRAALEEARAYAERHAGGLGVRVWR